MTHEKQQTTRWYEVKGAFFDAKVGTDDKSTITTTSPVLRRFRGKKLFQLRQWKEVVSVTRMEEEEL